MAKLFNKQEYSYAVQSVKRVSDGVIFSVGDKIGINGTSPEIFKIEIDDDHCWLHYLSIAVPDERRIYAKQGGINYTSEIKDAIKR